MMSGRSHCLLLLSVLLYLLLLVTPIHSVYAFDVDVEGEQDADIEARNTAEELGKLDASALASLTADIEAAVSNTEWANSQQPSGVDALFADSMEGKQLVAEAENTNAHADPSADADAARTFALIASSEDSRVNHAYDHVDIDSHLDTIATELNSLFQTEEQVAAAKAEKARIEEERRLSQTKKGRKILKQRRLAAKAAADRAARIARNAKRKAEKAAKLAAKQAKKNSRRQKRLIKRVDGYRTQRGHAEEAQDISALEAESHITHKHTAARGYSFPTGSAYAPPPNPAVATPVPNQPFNAYGQPFSQQPPPSFIPAVAPNNALWASLGVAPALAPAAVPVAAASSNVAGVGLLLQALKKVEQEQETERLAHTLATLLSRTSAAPTVLAPVQPVVAAQPINPFNYPFSYSGAPAYLPRKGQSVGVEQEQPNPFEDHQP